jgi:hypothetical protein
MGRWMGVSMNLVSGRALLEALRVVLFWVRRSGRAYEALRVVGLGSKLCKGFELYGSESSSTVGFLVSAPRLYPWLVWMLFVSLASVQALALRVA